MLPVGAATVAGVGQRTGPAGHRSLPHTADIRVEAWAPTRQECLAEAVTAVVESFADLSGCPPVGEVTALLDPGTDEDLLVDLLNEVIYQVDTAGQLPLAVAAEPLPDGGMQVRFRMADTQQAVPLGAAPKAVALHDLRFATDPDTGWSCAVTLDV